MAKSRITVETASSWVLRIGVLLSVVAMLTGVFISFSNGRLPLDRIEHARFEDPGAVWQGILTVRGQAIIELGIYLLVLTPIMRVVAAMVIFAIVDRDWLYVVLTVVTLILTLTGLLVLR
jgi:uncharacterized membrane protein